MLCEVKFEAEREPDYNSKWATVFNELYGENHQKWNG